MTKKTARTHATTVGKIIDQFPDAGIYNYDGDKCDHCGSKGALWDALDALQQAHEHLLEFATHRGRGKCVEGNAVKPSTC